MYKDTLYVQRNSYCTFQEFRDPPQEHLTALSARGSAGQVLHPVSREQHG